MKKRRVTTEQARLLTIGMIRDVLAIEMTTGPGTANSPKDWAIAYFAAYLPEKWLDDETSPQSWEHVWQETQIQLENIVDCLVAEAFRIAQDNPGFDFKNVKIAAKKVHSA